MYWGASFEVQTPLYFLPKEIGIKLAAFADAGSLWDYRGATSWNVTGETLQVGRFQGDTLLGRHRFDLGFPARPAALRSGAGADQGELRPYPVLPLQRRRQVLTLPARGGTAPIQFQRVSPLAV